MSEYVLTMKSIIKCFPGITALDKVDFNLKAGEVHALLGVNGAGKSTLIKVISGIYKKDNGIIEINGNPIEIHSAADSLKHGVTTVYQDPQVIPSFNAYENIFLGCENEKKNILSWFKRKELREKAKTLLKRFPVNIDLDKPVSQMSAIEKESISILRALSHDMSIFILDEPTSILTENEKHILFDTIEVFKKEGVAIIYITHRLEEVCQIADRATIFRNGKNVATLDSKEIQNVERIVELMLGKKISAIYPESSTAVGSEMLRVDNLSFKKHFKNISFSVKKGEILGIFGLIGSGLDELSKVLFGAYQKTSGDIVLKNETVNISSPQDAIKKGIYLVPSDRRREGLVAEESVYSNISLSNMKKVSRAAMVNRKIENRYANDLVEKLEVATPSVFQKAGLLSGGNQQKVVIAKALFSGAEVYIFAEPTVGVDVGAKMGIYYLIRELSKKSLVIVMSSDCEEVYGIADRIMVLYKGEAAMKALTKDVSIHEVLMSGVICEEDKSRYSR